MAGANPIHPDFSYLLNFKEKDLVNLFCVAR